MSCRVAMLRLILLCAACAGPAAEAPALSTLEGSQWSLQAWAQDDPAPADPLATLTYEEGRFAGRSGCNSYTGTVAPGDEPGEIAIGPVISTRMACPEMQMEVETRYLTALQAATKYNVSDGELSLVY